MSAPETRCPHHYDGGTLVCVRKDKHDPDADYGHTYEASWAPDMHVDGEAS